MCKCNLQMAQWHTFPRGCVQVQHRDGTMAYFSKGVCASATYRWHNGILFQGGVCKCNIEMAQWHTFPRGCVQVQPTDGTMAYFSKGVCASATYRWHNGILFQGGVCKCNLQMAQWHTFPREVRAVKTLFFISIYLALARAL